MKPDRPARKRSAKAGSEPAKRAKVTMLLPPELATRLHMFAVMKGKDIGQIAGEAIEQHISGFYVVDKTAGRSGAEPATEPERADDQDGPRLASVGS